MPDIRHILAGGLIAVALAHSPALAQATQAPDQTEQKADEKSPEQAELERLRKEKELLAARHELLLQQQRNELVQLELEKQRLQAETQVRQARQQEEIATLKADLERLQTEAQVRQAQQDARLADLKAQIAELQTDKQLADAQREHELAGLREEAQRIATENQVRAARVEQAKLQLQELQNEADAKLADLRKSLELRNTKDEAGDVVISDLDYAHNPFQNGALHISDRRISLNGPIITGTADWVCDRIHYYNNESTDLPIFIVIDNCPGGSVMQGYRIVKAIEKSKAPIHVVVKSFAASMAAIITTLADHSYAYPNAVILHHEMSSGIGGNMTELQEQLETAKEWERRLAVPVAEKMGVSLDEFRRLMYENNSNGDWEEFADQAVRLKWVNNVVQEIREDGVRKKPTGSAPTPWFFFIFGQADDATRAECMNAIQRDEKGRPFIQLPPLGPFDYYFLYDPKDFYRY